MKKEDLRVVATLTEANRVYDIGDYDVQLSMGNLVLTDRRGGLPRGYGSYSYIPYRGLSNQWQVLPDSTGKETPLRARIAGGTVVVAESLGESEQSQPADIASDEPGATAGGRVVAALATAAVGLAATAVASRIKKSQQRGDAPASPSFAGVAKKAQSDRERATTAPVRSADELYVEGRTLQAKGDHRGATDAFRAAIEGADDRTPSPSVAASLFQLGLQQLDGGDLMEGRVLLGRASKQFDAIATEARSSGRAEIAEIAATEAARARSIVTTAVTGKPWLVPDFTGSDTRRQQLDTMNRLDEDRMRINQSWAQGLGRI